MIRLIPDHKRADLGSSIDPNAIEQFLFSSSKTKDEYLELTARVIVHFKYLQNVETKEVTSKSIYSFPFFYIFQVKIPT